MKSRIFGSDSKILILRQDGGDLLDHNYSSCTEQNIGIIGKDVEVFRIMWMNDGVKFFACRW